MTGEKIKITCPDCEGGLVARNGMTYPIDRIVATLPVEQYEAWIEQGYPVQVVDEN